MDGLSKQNETSESISETVSLQDQAYFAPLSIRIHFILKEPMESVYFVMPDSYSAPKVCSNKFIN